MKYKGFFLDINRVICFLYALMGLLSLKPYIIWDHRFIYYSTILFLIIFFTTSVFKFKRLFTYNKLIFISFVVLFLIIYIASTSKVPGFITGSFIVAILFCMNTDYERLLAFRFFDKMMGWVLCAGLFLYPFIAFDILPSFNNLYPSNTLKQSSGFYYHNYIFNLVLSNQIVDLGWIRLFRFSSIFDEPGVVGTFCGVMLAAKERSENKSNFKVYLLSGLLSFSMAFYALLFISFLLKANKKHMIFLSCAFLTVLLLNPFLEGNSFYDKFVTSKYEYTNGELTIKNNRISSCFSEELTKLYNEDKYLFGYGPDKHKQTGCDVSSYTTVIYDYGYVGLLILYLLFIGMILYIFKSSNNRIYMKVSFIIVLSASLYQRPDLFIFYLLLIPLSLSDTEHKLINRIKD